MAQPISGLAVGTKVKDSTTTIYGKPIIWQVGDKNHAGYPANSVTLVSANIIKILCFDGREPGNPDTSRASLGNNRYSLSNLRQWLNKVGANWFTAQHGTDAPPSTANVFFGYNAYDTQAGFMTGFSAYMRSAILETTLIVAKPTADLSGSETVNDKVFLLSMAETGLGAVNGINEGTQLAMFSSANSSRVTYPTADAVSNSNASGSSVSGLSASAPWIWWVRSPYYADTYNVLRIDVDGSGVNNKNAAYASNHGLRPALNLPLSTLVSDSPDTDGAYIIQWNMPPTIPPAITVPTQVFSGQNSQITWAASIDPEGGPVSYELGASINGAAFANIYSGNGLSYAHPVTTDMNTVQYRVRAKDNVGEYSNYLTSQSRTVIHNVAPSVSGTDQDLGTISTPPSYSFSVTDPDAGDTVVVDISLDGNTVTQYDPAVQGQVYTVTLTDAQFYALSGGTHSLTITATDEYGMSSIRTITFARAVISVDFNITPIQTDAMSEKILISLQYYADPSNVSIQVCNNANDESPAWEAATQGLKHIFNNTTNTAGSWAVGVRVTIIPSTAYPTVYCAGLSGSYV